MEQETTSRHIRSRISKYYTIAVYSYVMPLVLLGLYVVDSLTFNLAFFFLPLTLLSLFPIGAIGLVFTIKGLRLAFHSSDYQKKDTGYANLIMGLILAGGGLIGLGLMYVMTLS